MPRAASGYGRLAARTIGGTVHRLIPSRYPPVGLFDAARNAEELEMLAELESLTNPRIRQELGAVHIVAPGEAVYGEGCTPIMAAFCHPAASRFSDGSFGIYYAALAVETAIAESRHHRERFLREAGIATEVLEMRCYSTALTQPMTLLPRDAAQRQSLLDPDSYVASQRFGASLRADGAWGLYYDSVRDQPDGRCVAVLRPRAVQPVTQTSHYRYFWNGQRIDQIESVTRLDLR